ncbi:Zn-dependent protease with chaperone function [Bradyrhizobium sp. GM5.1]
MVDIYRLARRLAALLGWHLPQVEQVNFEGHAFLIAGAVITFLAMVAFAVRFARSMMREQTTRALPDAPGDRRFRPIPARLLSDVEAKVRPLWQDMGNSPPPALVCFASTSTAACVTTVDGTPAIGLSTGLIDQLLKGDERLAQVILLHEMAHLVGGDVGNFRRMTAFVEAFRWVFLVFLIAIGLAFTISMPAEYFDLAGIDQRGPSLSAYLTRSARDLLFSYLSMLLVLRYVALIIMLTELRADLRAAMTLGSFETFALTVRAASGFRPSSRLHLVQSWVGTKVAHLTAGERLDLLERPSRLFTPKYRYFAASIGLCIFLIVDGSLAFSGFDWVLQAGIIATLAGLNAITTAMLLTNDFSGMRRIAFTRLLAIAVMAVAANLLFLFFPSDVMGTTDTVIVAITDPNFSYTAGTVLREWYAASAKPAVDAMLDGRAVLWAGSILVTLWGCARMRGSRSRGLVGAGAALVAACLTMLVAAGSPFATYLLLPERLNDQREPIRQFMVTFGPPIPIVIAGVLGLLLVAVGSRGRAGA